MNSGLAIDLAMRIYVFAVDSFVPVALAVRTCSVRFDLWDNVYQVRVHDPGAQPRNLAVATLAEAESNCLQASALPIVDRRYLSAGRPYLLAVAVDEVDDLRWLPIPHRGATFSRVLFGARVGEVLEQRASLPAGTTEIHSSDPLFVDLQAFARPLGASAPLARFGTSAFKP